jgi:hypothetical protein
MKDPPPERATQLNKTGGIKRCSVSEELKLVKLNPDRVGLDDTLARIGLDWLIELRKA